MPKFYLFRTTTQQLEQHLNHIAESGDSLVQAVHTGGRDWVLICTADPATVAVRRG